MVSPFPFLPPILAPLLLCAPLAAAPRPASAAGDGPPREEDRAVLLEGVDALAAPGAPGRLCVFGESAFCVVSGRDGDVEAAVVAAGEHGEGRLLLFAHGSYLRPGTLLQADTLRLLRNGLAWTTRERPGRIACPSSAELARFLTGLGYDAVDGWGDEVGDVDGEDAGPPAAVLLGPSMKPGPERIEWLAEYVRAGGALIASATGWGWQQLQPHLDLAEHHPGNRVTLPMGLAWSTGTVRDDERALFRPRTPHRLVHVRAAAEQLLDAEADWTDEEARIAEATLSAALGLLPGPEPAVLSVRRVLDELDLDAPAESPRERTLRRLAVREARRRTEALPPRERPAAPDAALFPGPVPDDAERVTSEVVVEAGSAGWIGTGLYAAPGEVVRLEVLEGELDARALLRIGCHKDRLWHKEDWQRWPEITTTERITGGRSRASCPHGGLVYVELPRDAAAARAVVSLEGAVRAPRFRRGHTTPEQWEEARRAPAPWGELEGEHVVFSLPRAVLAAVDDPGPLAEYWDRVWELHTELGGEPIGPSPERVVADVQISAGYMHSGYPIMTHLDGADQAVDLEALRAEGSWGHFHELGHNAQRAAWTFGGTVEVTCNLFTLYAMEHLVGIPATEHPRLELPRKQAAAYLADGGDFERWKREPFLALVMYVELIDEFGWEAYRAVFREYLEVPQRSLPRTDADRRDEWCARFSRTVGRDLSPFFRRWAVPVTPGAAARLSDLPPWSGPEAQGGPR